MKKTSGALLGAVLAAVLALLAGVTLAKGGFFVGKHEGDTLHLLQMAMRMAGGEWPHLDFHTPIGMLAIAPIALFLWLGQGAGHAILWAQILVAILALPAIWWVAHSRFRGVWAYFFGIIVLVLILALIHGVTNQAVSISMHYNRWAWAVSFLVIATALMPTSGGRGAALADGIVIGVGITALALIKVTYFGAFLIPVLVAMIGRKAWTSLWVGALVGLAVVALVTLLAGTPLFWLAYLRDLLTVMGSDLRPYPGVPFTDIMIAPAYVGASLVLFAAVILMRQAGHRREGLTLLLLAPGFFYVTYQNFGNDPQWLGLLAVMLISLKPEGRVENGFGWDVTAGFSAVTAIAFAFAAPSLINLALSPFRHLSADPERYAAMMPGSGIHEDLRRRSYRFGQAVARVSYDLEAAVGADRAEPLPDEAVTEWNGEVWPDCTLTSGNPKFFATVAADLAPTGLAEGKTVFAADIQSAFWLFGAFEPLPGAAPWYYGGLPGFAAADYLLVPRCPASVSVRRKVLDAVDDTGVSLEEVHRTELYVLYAK